MTDELSNEIKPVTVRQIAIAALLVIAITSFVLYLVYHRQQQKKLIMSKSVIIPKIIKHSIASEPKDLESLSFVIPLTK